MSENNKLKIFKRTNKVKLKSPYKFQQAFYNPWNPSEQSRAASAYLGSKQNIDEIAALQICTPKNSALVYPFIWVMYTFYIKIKY